MPYTTPNGKEYDLLVHWRSVPSEPRDLHLPDQDVIIIDYWYSEKERGFSHMPGYRSADLLWDGNSWRTGFVKNQSFKDHESPLLTEIMSQVLDHYQKSLESPEPDEWFTDHL